MKSYLYGAFLAGVITLGILVGGYAATLVFDIGGRYVISSEEEIREASPVESGVSKKAAIFLRHFRKPIFSRVGEFGRMEKELMRKELLDGYAKDGVLLDEWSTYSSDRERFLTYLMLRVNGSLPNYVSDVPDSLPELLTSAFGNCETFALRLLIVLDLFGIVGREVGWNTASLIGHYLVDAYDPIEKRSYFFDPNFNLIASAASPREDAGFIDILLSKNILERKNILTQSVKSYPTIFDSSNVQGATFYTWAEAVRSRALDSTSTALSQALNEMVEKWSVGSTHIFTLCELADNGQYGLVSFRPSYCLSSDSILSRSSFQK